MLYRVFAAVVLVLFATACSAVKDEPLPLSRENIEKYAAARVLFGPEPVAVWPRVSLTRTYPGYLPQGAMPYCLQCF